MYHPHRLLEEKVLNNDAQQDPHGHSPTTALFGANAQIQAHSAATVKLVKHHCDST